MTYAVSSTILASDLNSFLTSMRSIYGVGTGNYGYGITTITQADVVAGTTVVSSSHFNNLIGMMATCNTHQGSGVTLVPTNLLDVGDTVVAHESSSPSLNAYDIDSGITTLTNNRMTASATNMTLTSSAATVTRSSAWSGTINSTVRIAFTNENAARHFFNTGGEIRLAYAHTNIANGNDTEWNTFLSSWGTIKVKGNSVIRTGSASGSYIVGTGFYGMTSTYSNQINAVNWSGGAYTGDDFTVQGRVGGVIGSLGGNGTYVEILTSMFGGYTTQSGTNLVVSIYRASGLGIASPTVSIIDGF